MTLDERLLARGFSLASITEDGETKLALKDLEDEAVMPLTVDFTSPALVHRLKHGLSKNQPLGRALGLKSMDPELAPFVFDATAGLGTDALIIAALGCRVRSLERSDVIFALLKDGKQRLLAKACEDDELKKIADRMSFEHGDARAILAAIANGSAPAIDHTKPDVVYLDPMYPDDGRANSALPKKTMQMFRRLLDGDEDASELWEAAMSAALKRVVVKRPMKAPPLGSQKPSHSFEGKTARFDLYLVP